MKWMDGQPNVVSTFPRFLYSATWVRDSVCAPRAVIVYVKWLQANQASSTYATLGFCVAFPATPYVQISFSLGLRLCMPIECSSVCKSVACPALGRVD